MKQASKRKISEECMVIYGSAQKNFWDGNYDQAREECVKIMEQCEF